MVKSAAGAFIQAVHEGSEPLPQWARVYRAVRRAVDGGALLAGTRLPSARQLARDWQVSRGAVDEAFAQLQLEGLLERRVGDGTYVSTSLRPPQPGPQRQPRASTQPVLCQLRAISLPAARRELARDTMRPLLLHPRGMPLDLFPLEAWRRLVAQAHDSSQRSLLGGGPPGGLPALREAIARHLALARGIACSPEQVLVLSGPREGLSAMAAQLLRPRDLVATEDPSHPSLQQLLALLGARVHGVPLDEEGFRVADLRRHADDARAVYLHPLSQYPLGLRTTAPRGQDLLAWAEQRQAWIIEGHYNDEWVPRAQQPPTLFSRDRAERVLLLGTFEGVMFPSLRVGYLVLPKGLAPRFIANHALRGERVPLGTQWAVAQFIDGGLMSDHLLRVRADLGLRRTQVRAALLAALPAAVRMGAMDTGAQVCLHLGQALKDTAVAERLREHGVLVEPVSPMTESGTGANGIVLGYAGWELPRVLEAICRVGQVLQQMVPNSTGADRASAVAPRG